MRIYLVRHGQTTGDVEDRYGGDYDDHLTEEGKKQAEELAQKLQHIGIQYIYTSPKIRALETAEVLCGKLGIPMEIVKDLRERNYYGILTGMTKSEAGEKFPGETAKVGDFEALIEGGEDYQSFKDRIHLALKKLSFTDYDKIAIITHGGPISTIFREMLKTAEVKITDCAYAVIEGQGDKFVFITGDGISFI